MWQPTGFLHSRGIRLKKYLAAGGGSAVAATPTREQEPRTPQIHITAGVDPSANLGWGVVVGPYATIGKCVTVGENTIIEAGSFIDRDVTIGSSTCIGTRSVIRECTTIGSRCTISPGVILGTDGFGYAKGEDGLPHKIPQVGHVVIGDNVRIGSLSTIDRATLGQTVLEDNVQLGCLSQIGHNAVVGKTTEVGDRVGICGSCKIGDGVNVGDSAGLVGHIRIGDKATISAGSGVTKDLDESAAVAGMRRSWHSRSRDHSRSWRSRSRGDE